MKKMLLWVSALLNVIFLGVLAYGLTQKPAKNPISPIKEARSEAPKQEEPRLATPKNNEAPEGRAEAWENVESEDYKEYIRNLRAIGCPEKTIGDIIRADVNKLYATRASALRQKQPVRPYWKLHAGMNGNLNPELLKAQLELQKEKKELLQELLGQANL